MTDKTIPPNGLSKTPPLFIVGMPRSGTKLLRAILNRHPSVSIPDVETEFLPFWVSNWQTFGDLSDWSRFERFADRCQGLPFFLYLRDAGEQIDVADWYSRCRSFEPAGVFEGLILTHLNLQGDSGVIWGDKSPSYVRHLELLHRLYSEAKFVHIIRDVRDYCRSIHKAWGKNALRAAHRWAEDVGYARSIGRRLADDYLEIHYEDLIRNPSETIGTVCAFLGIPFSENLLDLSRPTENLGDTRDVAGIDRENVGKYEEYFDAGTVTSIEAIASQVLVESGYDCSYGGESRRLGTAYLRYLQLLDGLNLVRFAVRERGFWNAIRFVSSYYRISGNRLSDGG